jgi:hypothetical protein
MATGRSTTRSRWRRRDRRAWWVPVLAATATGLIGLAFVPDLAPSSAPLAQDAASVAAVAGSITSVGGAVSPAPARSPADAGLAANAPGAIVVRVPDRVQPPAFVVPRPVVVPGSIVPPYVPVGVSPRLTPPPAKCGGYATPRKVTPTVVPGKGSARVSFPADSSTAVRSYRVQAVSQRLVGGSQPPHVIATAPQRSGCGQVSVTLTGLRSGTPYVFWIEELQSDPHSTASSMVQVGSSAPVVVG